MTQSPDPSVPYITQPADHMAEGEAKVSGSGLESERQVMAFVMALFRAALDADSNTYSPPEISSLSLERLGPIRGRVYGQAYLERPGTTVHFLRVRLFDDKGEPVLSGMATSHVS
ncbi:MAG: hypothetical protein JSU77_13550 [Fidelibacterota bacterium]|nr:MAG: hypothetical protein JSU77_13550 [Candidatus Neomarinimicrobiota bacterium]